MEEGSSQPQCLNFLGIQPHAHFPTLPLYLSHTHPTHKLPSTAHGYCLDLPLHLPSSRLPCPVPFSSLYTIPHMPCFWLPYHSSQTSHLQRPLGLSPGVLPWLGRNIPSHPTPPTAQATHSTRGRDKHAHIVSSPPVHSQFVLSSPLPFPPSLGPPLLLCLRLLELWFGCAMRVLPDAWRVHRARHACSATPAWELLPTTLGPRGCPGRTGPSQGACKPRTHATPPACVRVCKTGTLTTPHPPAAGSGQTRQTITIPAHCPSSCLPPLLVLLWAPAVPSSPRTPALPIPSQLLWCVRTGRGGLPPAHATPHLRCLPPTTTRADMVRPPHYYRTPHTLHHTPAACFVAACYLPAAAATARACRHWPASGSLSCC